MEKTSKELLKEFVNSQHFTSTTLCSRIFLAFFAVFLYPVAYFVLGYLEELNEFLEEVSAFFATSRRKSGKQNG